MTIGPVQLMMLGFNDPQAHGAIADELKRLRDSEMVRVVDALMVVKDANGRPPPLPATGDMYSEPINAGLAAPPPGHRRVEAKLVRKGAARPFREAT